MPYSARTVYAEEVEARIETESENEELCAKQEMEVVEAEPDVKKMAESGDIVDTEETLAASALYRDFLQYVPAPLDNVHLNCWFCLGVRWHFSGGFWMEQYCSCITEQ